jgi:Ca2+-binding RTX toxin-like protein
MVGFGATLVLEGTVSSGLTVDFAGAGTLVVAASGVLGAIQDFGPSDTILLPVNGATSAPYALTGPGEGVVSVLDGSTVLQNLTLAGSAAGEVFNVGGVGGGGTILTATPANTAGVGGDTVPSDSLVPGSNILTAAQLQSLAEGNFPYASAFVQALDDNETCDLWYLDGQTTVGPPLFGPGGVNGVDVELVAPTEGNTGTPMDYILQAGYSALIAEGTEPVNLFDQNVGNALLVSNANVDPQYTSDLVTLTNNDTLVGATGGNSVFWASGGVAGTEYVTVQGGGNDTIVTNEDNAVITTSGGGRSVVYIGSSDNFVLAQGNDAIVCGGTVGGVAHDTVDAAGAPGATEPDVFGPAEGEVVVHGDANAAVVVGGGGQILMDGGAAPGNELWAGNSPAEYFGGAGAGVVVGGSGYLYVQGGRGPVTVYGGTGPTIIEGSAGNSTYVLGEGAATVAAGAGNTVFITGSAPVSVAGTSGVVAYAGQGTGNYVFNANAGSETLWGGTATDQFFAGSGNANMVSGGGVDVFNFTNGLGGGSDTIYNFVPGKDVIALHGFGGALPSLSVQSGSTYFSLSDGTHVEVSNLTNLTGSSFSSS